MKFTRLEPADSDPVQELFVSAFTDSEGPSEGSLIGELVADLMQTTPARDLSGFVARQGNRVAAAIFVSRLVFDNPVQAWLLAPVAVRPEYQGQGVGQGLIEFGIARLKSARVDLLFTYGDPAFYAKVGFVPVTEAIARAPLPLTQPQGWLCQSLSGGEIEPIPGKSLCVEAFNKPVYW